MAMFCERCGRLLNRATGRCVCDDDPRLATPPEPQHAPEAFVRQDGDAAAARRAVTDIAQALGGVGSGGADGGSAVAVLSRPQPSAGGVAAAAAAAPVAYQPPQPPAPRVVDPGRLRGTIPDLRARWTRFDVRVHEACLVVCRVGGVDPVLMGRVVGLLVLGPLGLLVGDAMGRWRAKRQRARRLAMATFVVGDAAEVLPVDQLVAVTVEPLPWGGRVRIGAGGGGHRSFRWSRRDLDLQDVAGPLQAAADRRVALQPSGHRLRIVHRAGVVALVLAAVATVAVPVKLVAFPAPPPGHELPPAARTALHRACPAWRSTPLAGAGLVATVERVRSDVERAASAAPTAFAGLHGAMDVIARFAPKAGAPGAPLEEAARFSDAVDTVDAACTRVGA
jgi:hypothetical protein